MKRTKRLFISQPSLSNAIRDLEQELRITIFERTNKGISLSKEGVEFLSYARQVVEQAELLENRYLNAKPSPRHFSVSTALCVCSECLCSSGTAVWSG